MAFIVCFFIGFVMCMPVGPINVWVMNTYLKKSRSHALSLAAGGVTMDFCYFMIILTGLSVLEFSQEVNLALKALGITLIFVMGVKEFFTTPQIDKKDDVKVTRKNQIGYFTLGAFLYISNPTLIVTMSAIGAFLKSLELYEFTQLNIFLSSLGLSVGAFVWFFTLTQIVGKFEKVIREKYLVTFNKVSGALMVIFSVVMAYKLIKMVNV